VSLCDLRDACRNCCIRYGRALSGASARPIIRRHCASRGWRG
jgi:hypothetical protein